MKKIIAKTILISFLLTLAVSLQAAVTNMYYSDWGLSNLPIQPLSDDLAQGIDATNIIVAGGMNAYSGLHSNYFEYLFNSPSNGDLGIGCPETVAGKEVILGDASIPSTLTLEMNCNFTTTKMVQAVHVFSNAGDSRLFTYGEVYASLDSVNYTNIGVVSFGEWGDSINPYTNKYCVASLYNTDTNIYLAENIVALKIIFRGVMDTTWADTTHKVLDSSGGSSISEIDVLGKDGNIPPPPPPPVATNTIYVSPLGTSNGSNYFTIIQDAVDVAVAGNLVLVSNGVYNTGGAPGEDGVSLITNRVFCTKAIEIRSVDGPANTIIVGAPGQGGDNGPGAIRCVCFPWQSGATLSGFTLSNGYTLASGDPNREGGGGGARIRKNGLITNCIVVANSAHGFGGGINLQSGTAADCKVLNNYSDAHAGGIFSQGGNIYNSVISDNEASLNGGGVWFYSIGGEGGQMYDSIISGNTTDDKGGGVYLLGNSGDPGTPVAKVLNCTVCSNSAGFWGGGFNVEFGGEIYNSKIFANEALGHNGGGVYFYHGGKIYNSLIYKNQTMNHGGGIFFDNGQDTALTGGEVYNCTIAANFAMLYGGGINMYNSSNNYYGLIVNSIISTNVANGGDANWAKGPNGTSPYNCTIGPLGGLAGPGNISNNPEFVSIELDDYHLLSISPCINAGTNGAVTTTVDLDGNPRIEQGTVDMGCYESIPEPCLFIIYYLSFIIYYLKRK